MTREQNQQMEAAILRCVSKYVFLEISQYPYEKHKSICVRVSLEWSYKSEGLQLYSKETPTQAFFSCEYFKNFKNSFFVGQFRWLPLSKRKSIFLHLIRNAPEKIERCIRLLKII